MTGYTEATLERLRQAVFRVEDGKSVYDTFIQEIAAEVDVMLAERDAVGVVGPETLMDLATKMRTNSERWFPKWHDGTLPLPIAYALGLGGEVGEVLNVVKKMHRDGDAPVHREALAMELADVFTYLMLLVDEADVDLIGAFVAKQHICEERYQRRMAMEDLDPASQALADDLEAHGVDMDTVVLPDG